MKDIQNEKGIALVMAILTLVVFSILGLAIVTITNQGQKQRDLSNEQIEGKMLADTGLLYFQKYLDAQLKSIDIPSLRTSDLAITTALKTIATDPTIVTDKSKYITTYLPVEEGRPQGSEGSFQVFYQDEPLVQPPDPTQPSKVLYQDDLTGSSSQPYIRKLKVSVIGIPADTSHFKRVKVTATVYINTIASPFHYAISTPSELNLYGGSNIIGNIMAKQINVSTEYYYSDQDIYHFEPENPINLPYVEGKIFLPGDPVFFFKKGTWQLDSDGHPAHYPSFTQNVYTDRQSLQSVFTPYPLGTPSPPVDAPVEKPFIPGSEPPLVESSSQANQGLNINLSDYIESEFKTIAPSTGTKLVVNDTDQQQPIWIGAGTSVDGFRTNFNFANSDIAIYTEQTENQLLPSYDPNNLPPFLLTARLTDNTISSTTPRRLFIGSDPNGDYDKVKAVVEMGHNTSFSDLSNYPSDHAFNFNGSIFIKGNLDIVGDINVNGTIYVDGDVNIRENTGSTTLSNIPNLVILSTGTITISDRNRTDSPNFSWNNRLNAFLYSQSQPIKIYSHTSVNWFYGGLATGAVTGSTPYIELDTKREDPNPINSDTDPYASHMTIQFNRGIFEKGTPGLPSDNQLYLDTYDISYDDINPD